VVVLLDLDALVLQPLDTVFDLILYGTKPDNVEHHLQWPEKALPDEIHALYTVDYAMVSPGRKVKPFQGGFAIVRPNRTVYDEFVSIIRQGDFRFNGGWGGQTGKFWGAQTFQGLMPYYYQVLHPGRAVELNWCTYNNMASPSRDNGVVNDKAHGVCLTNETDCEDCRERDVDSVISTHFTVCQKPWGCMSLHRDILENRLCRNFHNKWFQMRSEMERSWGRSGWGDGAFDRDQFFGYCTGYGKKGYTLVKPPYGSLADKL
jgi:hypothetical protein